MQDRLRVLLGLNVPEHLVDTIRAVEPERVEVRHLARPERRALRRVAEPTPEVAASLDEALRWAEVLVCDQRAIDDTLPVRAPNLRWIQVTNAGIDYLTRRGLHRIGVTISNARGIHGANMGEYVTMMALAFTKRVNVYVRAQARHEWSHAEPRELAGTTMGIIGLGEIGKGVARYARAFGMRVVALRRTAAGGEVSEHADHVFGVAGLHDLLERSDFVTLALPWTSESHHLIDEAALRAMKPDAVLINISRGDIVDEQALIRALRDGWIGGAALDVFEQEPLPAESPLWDMENVLITPHMSGNTPRYFELVIELFCRSLRRVLDGGRPLTVVNVEAGY